MKIPDALAKAIAVFRELGWEGADPERIMTLPLGTPEQQRVAKAGLSAGEWGGIAQTEKNTYGWVSWIDVDPGMLGAFAVRVGVPARRAVAVMPTGDSFPAAVRGELIAARGPAFAAAFADAGRRAAWQLVPILHAVTATGIDVPTSLGYLERWADLAAATLDASDPVRRREQVSPELIGTRYADHLRAALRSGNPAPQGAAALVRGGIDQGWIDADEARELVLFAMEQAQRPSDRTVWARVLAEALETEPEWLRERAGVLLATMSFGDDAIITLFSPTLLASENEDVVSETMLIGLLAKSAKAKAALIEEAARTPQPGAETTALVAESLVPLLAHKDRKLRRAVMALDDAWGLGLAARAADSSEHDEPSHTRGLWKATPPIAEVPRFSAGPVTSEHLTLLTATLLTARTEAITLDAERFLATANALARVDRDAARTALAGVKMEYAGFGLFGAHAWTTGEESVSLDRAEEGRGTTYRMPFQARSASVFQRLGAVSGLLSTPSWDDYRIDPEDLAARLDAYQVDGEHALEADLQLALPRIDLDLVTARLVDRLTAMRVPILLQDGTILPQTVGDVLGAWIREPLAHPGFEDEQSALPREFVPVPALSGLPPRLTQRYLWVPIPVFPNWPNARIADRDPAAATLRKRPNGPVPSSQLLDNVGEDAAPLDATIAAWHNGVLIPGVAEAPKLGWRGQIPSLAARAAAWAELAEEGLLSLVWPLAAEAIAYSSRGARVAPGVAELVELLDLFLPETQAAIATGLAAPDALELAGVRALAQRGGSSRAVTAARTLVEKLPEIAPVSAQAVRTMSEEEFRAAWPEIADPPAVPDGASVRIERREGRRGSFLEPVITLADGAEHRVENVSWIYPLLHENQALSGGDLRSGSWLRYSAAAAALVAAGDRNAPREERDRVLSTTLVLVLCLSQYVERDTPTYDFYAAIAHGGLGAQRMSAAIDELLTLEGVDPHRLVRALPRHPEGAPALYPVLTRSLAFAAGLDGAPPRWLVRIIDIATEFAPLLREAAERGLIPAADAAWPGLLSVATSSASPTARRKATLLAEMLGLPAAK